MEREAAGRSSRRRRRSSKRQAQLRCPEAETGSPYVQCGGSTEEYNRRAYGDAEHHRRHRGPHAPPLDIQARAVTRRSGDPTACIASLKYCPMHGLNI